MSRNLSLLTIAIISIIITIIGIIAFWATLQAGTATTPKFLGGFLVIAIGGIIVFLFSLLRPALNNFRKAVKNKNKKITITAVIEGETITIVSYDLDEAMKLVEKYASLRPKVTEQDGIKKIAIDISEDKPRRKRRP